MQQIADWLKNLGMSEYAQRFAENRIDFSVLRDLTDQDLKDIGVVLGDRRKILRATAELDAVAAVTAPARSKPAPPPGPTPNPAQPPTATAGVEAAGERRRSGRERPAAGGTPRYSAAARARPSARGRGIAAPAIGRADQLGDGWRQGAAGGVSVRGPPVGRSDDP